MGSFCCRCDDDINIGNNNDNYHTVILNAKTLKSLFDSHYDSHEKQILLSYIPISCNYSINSIKPKLKLYYQKSNKPLFKHMILYYGYFSLYKIRVSKDYYKDLLNFNNNNRVRSSTSYVSI